MQNAVFVFFCLLSATVHSAHFKNFVFDFFAAAAAGTPASAPIHRTLSSPLC